MNGMNEPRLRHGLHELAERLVPDEVDLYPAIRAQIEAPGQRSGPHGKTHQVRHARRQHALGRGVPARQAAGPPWNSVGRRSVRLGLATLGLVLLVGLALLQALSPIPMLPGLRQSATPRSAATRAVTVQLAEAQRRIPFLILQPTWLPRDLALVAVTVVAAPAGHADQSTSRAPAAAGPVTVVLAYRLRAPQGPHALREAAPGATAGELRLSLTQGPPPEPAQPTRAQSMHSVVVGGQVATYIRGVRLNSATLIWTMKDGDISCVLSDEGLGLGAAAMVRTAASL